MSRIVATFLGVMVWGLVNALDTTPVYVPNWHSPPSTWSGERYKQTNVCVLKREGACVQRNIIRVYGQLSEQSLADLLGLLGSDARGVTEVEYANGAAYVYLWNQQFTPQGGCSTRFFAIEKQQWRLVQNLCPVR